MKHLDTLRVLAAALRGNNADTFAAVPRQVEWEPLLAVAARQRVLPALAPLARLLSADAELYEDLSLIAALNLRRNRIALQELEAVLLCCNNLGIEPVLLKGSARIVAGSKAVLTSRYLGDLDLLVHPEQITHLAGALKQMGYYGVPYDAQDHPSLKHYPRLIHPHRTFAVELHRALGEDSWRHILPPSLAFAGARPATLGAAKCRLLAGTHAVIHAILHCQLDNRGHWFGELSLASMNDCLSIMQKEGIAWNSVHPAFARCGLAAVSRNFERWVQYLFERAEPPKSIACSLLRSDLQRHISYPAAWCRWYVDQIFASSAARRRVQDKLLDPQRWLGLSRRMADWTVRASLMLIRTPLNQTTELFGYRR